MSILGMLTVEPMSGYDMKQFCDDSLSHFWHETFGNLYPRLKQLSDDGLIKGKREQRERGPDAIVYSITARGRTRLRQWLKESPESERVRSEFMLKFFFGSNVPADVNEQRILEYEKEQKRLRNQYKTIEQALTSVLDEHEDENAFYWLMSLRRGQLLTDARLRWCRECRSKFEEFNSKGTSK